MLQLPLNIVVTCNQELLSHLPEEFLHITNDALMSNNEWHYSQSCEWHKWTNYCFNLQLSTKYFCVITLFFWRNYKNDNFFCYLINLCCYIHDLAKEVSELSKEDLLVSVYQWAAKTRSGSLSKSIYHHFVLNKAEH